MGRREEAGKPNVPCQVLPHPLGWADTLPRVRSFLQTQDGVSSIEAYESRKSHGKKGHCGQSTAISVEMYVDHLEIMCDGGL